MGWLALGIDVLRAALMAIAALFPIINPIGGAAIYLHMTHGLTPETRRELARKVGINSCLLMLGAALTGTYVLNFFGVSLQAVQVGGGFVLISSAWALLRRDDSEKSTAETPDATRLLGRAFHPFTLPLTIGPGTISVAITLGATLPEKLAQRTFSPMLLLGLILGIIVMSFLVYWFYAYAERVGAAIGPTATSVVLRLSSFILLCIGVQITWNGLVGLAAPLMRK